MLITPADVTSSWNDENQPPKVHSISGVHKHHHHKKPHLVGAAIVANRAQRHSGVNRAYCWDIAFACRHYRIRYSIGYALINIESNFKHIYGHDAGGLLQGQHVSRDNYLNYFRPRVSRGGSGANGVGLSQVTYWTYIRDHKGLWKPRANIYFGIGIVASNIHTYGERKGLAVYNGGAGNPNYAYASEVEHVASEWRRRIS